MAWTRTLGQMKTDLGTWLGVDANASNPNYVRLPEDVREFLIMQARRRIFLRRDLRFFQETDTITTANGSYTNGLPANWGRPYYMWYNDSSTNKDVEITNIDRSKWRTLYNSDSTSNAKPEKYCVYGSNYIWAPTPDAGYTLYCDYFAIPADLEGDSAYDEFLTKGWDAIFFEACAKGCAYVMELSRLGEFKTLAREHLSALGGDDARARYSGRGLQNEIPG